MFRKRSVVENREKHRSFQWSRIPRYAAPAAIAGLVLSTLTASAHAVDRGTFELDGNATEASTLAGDDWSNALGVSGTPSSSQLANTGVVVDGLNSTIFTGGGSKDDLDITSWRHTNGSVPDKDEITNAYAAAYKKGANNDLVVYFGADRFATNGNAALGFWFFQQNVAPAADGTFTGAHTPGDLLILSEFTNGGSQPTIQVYKWEPGGPINGTLRLLTNGNSTCNATQDPTKPEPLACAIVNTQSIPSPWPYAAKSGPANQFGKGAFFEGGVNVSALFGGDTPCFSSFLAETRSSQSVDATLKDFDGGVFPLCSADISITGSDVNEVGDPHTFKVKVEKTAAGTTSPVEGVNPVVTLTASGGAAVAAGKVDNCATTGTDTNGECTVTFNSNTAGIITGSATVSFSSGGQNFDVATGTTAATGAAVKRYVDAKISINPPLDTNGITESHTFTVKVEQDDGYPAGSPGDGASGFGPKSGVNPVVTLTESNGAVVTNKTDNCATTGTNSSGECTVTFTSNSAGTVTGSATISLTFTGLTGTVTRTTDGTAANSSVAVKHFVKGTLAWLKHDQDGALLGGATFEVCRTKSYDSATSVHTAITPVCVSVVDNSAPDTDADDGKFKMENLVMGTYTVRETAAPAGYSFDSTETKTALVETLAPNATISVAFVNIRQFKLIVITCNQVTNELVESSVTLNNVTKDTLTGTGASSLCTLGGANYGNLNAGTYKPDVVIPKP